MRKYKPIEGKGREERAGAFDAFDAFEPGASLQHPPQAVAYGPCPHAS